jgi:hypothetical protein
MTQVVMKVAPTIDDLLEATLRWQGQRKASWLNRPEHLSETCRVAPCGR